VLKIEIAITRKHNCDINSYNPNNVFFSSGSQLDLKSELFAELTEFLHFEEQTFLIKCLRHSRFQQPEKEIAKFDNIDKTL
jgi:hypothetical protein